MSGFLPMEKDGVKFFRFAALSRFPGLSHAVFTRHGGVSPGAWASLNIGRNVGDTSENVRENRERMARVLGARELVFIRQVHGREVFRVEGLGGGTGLVRQIEEGGDALVTDTKGAFLAVTVADCQPVLLHDPGRGVVAAAHGGWRGTLANVAANTVRAMQGCYGTRPGDVVACVGPSLGPCCGEFVNYKDEIPGNFWKYRTGEHHFDFWAITRNQLQAAGVREENIHTAGLCTKCRQDVFYSYRGGGTTGRFAAVIGIREDDDGKD
jgi:YfiH family protein